MRDNYDGGMMDKLLRRAWRGAMFYCEHETRLDEFICENPAFRVNSETYRCREHLPYALES